MSNKDFKIDLHLHADGSLPLQTVFDLAYSNPYLLTDDEYEKIMSNDKNEVSKLITVQGKCESLAEYLKYFNLPLKLMQKPNNMRFVGFAIGDTLRQQGINYAEVRFAPQLHSNGISKKEKFEYEKQIVSSFIEGIRKATVLSSTKIGVILCMMRNLPEKADGFDSNLRTLLLAKEFLGKGVCGLDLAGDEARDATADFESLFIAAQNLQIPFTIHAGEAGSIEWKKDSIERAIYFGAKRIGHGVALETSKGLRNLVRELGIVVECCPTSNLQTHAIENGIASHPIKRLLDEGIKVCVNTDNMTVSGITIEDEYELLRGIGIKEDELIQMKANAIDGAFCSDTEKKHLRRKLHG